MAFINVTADQCNVQGQVLAPRQPRASFDLNEDLIGAYRGNEVWLKSGAKFINLGGNCFTNIRRDGNR